MSRINLPSIPRSADRDTTVFLQSLKKAVESLSASDKTELSEAAKSYVLRIDKNTREDLVGVIGDESGIGAILDKLKGQITESELSIGLGTRIAKIDSNEGAISAERQERIAELILTNQAIIDEALARANAVSGNAALIVQESEARLTEDAAITRNLNLLNTQINGDGVSSSSSIVQQLTTVSNKTDTNATDISGLTSAFVSEMYGTQGTVVRNAQTAASASAANASDISGVFAQVNPLMAGDTNRWAGDNNPLNLVGVWSERSARIEDGMYTAERFDAMTARVDGNAAAISTETKIRIDEIKAVAQRTDTLRTDFNANAGVVQTKIQAAADATSALSARVDTVQASSGANTSSIQTQSTAIAGINTKLSATWSVKADVNGVVGGIALGNDGATVDFIVRASTFAVQGPSGSKSVPFVIYPDGAWIGGVWVPAGVFIDTAFVRRGSFDSLSALSATIGHFKSAPSGARLEIKDSLLSVYDANNTLRVRLGLW